MQNFVEKTEDMDEIKEHTDRLIRIFSQRGGFVFSQVHNFQHDTDVRKILAIYDTAKKYKLQEETRND